MTTKTDLDRAIEIVEQRKSHCLSELSEYGFDAYWQGAVSSCLIILAELREASAEPPHQEDKP